MDFASSLAMWGFWEWSKFAVDFASSSAVSGFWEWSKLAVDFASSAALEAQRPSMMDQRAGCQRALHVVKEWLLLHLGQRCQPLSHLAPAPTFVQPVARL